MEFVPLPAPPRLQPFALAVVSTPPVTVLIAEAVETNALVAPSAAVENVSVPAVNSTVAAVVSTRRQIEPIVVAVVFDAGAEKSVKPVSARSPVLRQPRRSVPAPVSISKPAIVTVVVAAMSAAMALIV
jgi:hypothetical protein